MNPENLFTALEFMPQGTRIPSRDLLAHVNWNQQGVVPVITQDVHSRMVLMMAWMNAEALTITLGEQRMCYWSRSRQCLWRKGETSGNRQRLCDLRIDCDGDAILCLVEQIGPACHTGRPNCFYWQVNGDIAEIMTAPAPPKSGRLV